MLVLHLQNELFNVKEFAISMSTEHQLNITSKKVDTMTLWPRRCLRSSYDSLHHITSMHKNALKDDNLFQYIG